MLDLDRAERRRSLLVALLVGLACLARSESATQSRLPASKLAGADGADPSECADESSESRSSADEPDSPTPPDVRIGDEVLEAPIDSTILVDARRVHLRPLHDELQLTYVHNLVAAEEIHSLVRLASARDGWGRSPLKSQRSGERLSKDERRNSSSCPMLWPLVYEGREDEIRTSAGERAASLLEELALVRKLSERVAELFVATGMPLTPRHIEPLQLVRYLKSETFLPHHDYHEPAPDGTLGSSVQGEQRAFTVLLFGATLSPVTRRCTTPTPQPATLDVLADVFRSSLSEWWLGRRMKARPTSLIWAYECRREQGMRWCGRTSMARAHQTRARCMRADRRSEARRSPSTCGWRTSRLR